MFKLSLRVAFFSVLFLATGMVCACQSSSSGSSGTNRKSSPSTKRPPPPRVVKEARVIWGDILPSEFPLRKMKSIEFDVNRAMRQVIKKTNGDFKRRPFMEDLAEADAAAIGADVAVIRDIRYQIEDIDLGGGLRYAENFPVFYFDFYNLETAADLAALDRFMSENFDLHAHIPYAVVTSHAEGDVRAHFADEAELMGYEVRYRQGTETGQIVYMPPATAELLWAAAHREDSTREQAFARSRQLRSGGRVVEKSIFGDTVAVAKIVESAASAAVRDPALRQMTALPIKSSTPVARRAKQPDVTSRPVTESQEPVAVGKSRIANASGGHSTDVPSDTTADETTTGAVALLATFQTQKVKRWRAAGPLQHTWSNFDSEKEAMATATKKDEGPATYLGSFSVNYAGQSRAFRIYTLNRPLESGEIDIRPYLSKYGIDVSQLPR